MQLLIHVVFCTCNMQQINVCYYRKVVLKCDTIKIQFGLNIMLSRRYIIALELEITNKRKIWIKVLLILLYEGIYKHFDYLYKEGGNWNTMSASEELEGVVSSRSYAIFVNCHGQNSLGFKFIDHSL